MTHAKILKVLICAVASALALGWIVVPSAQAKEVRSGQLPGRPVLQALTEYRAGGKTLVHIASTVPIAGARSYRLEKFDPATQTWIFVGGCPRLCRVQMSNTDMGNAVSFRMRAVAADRSLSLPSVALSVSPRLWNDRKRPGSTVTYRLGDLSYGVVGKGVLQLMSTGSLAQSCAIDTALRQALDGAVGKFWEMALRSANIYLGLVAFVATFVERYHSLVYGTHCDVVKNLVNAMVDAGRAVNAGTGTELEITTYWTANKVMFGPGETPLDQWTCNVYIRSQGPGYETRLGVSEKACYALAKGVWFAGGS